MRKSHTGLLFLPFLVLLLPFFCESRDAGFTLERLLVLVRGSCWVLGPVLGRSWGVGRGSLMQGCPLAWGGGTPMGDQGSATHVGGGWWDSHAWPAVAQSCVSPRGLGPGTAGRGRRVQTWLGISGQSRHHTESKEFLSLKPDSTTALMALSPILFLQGMSHQQSAC